MSEDPRPDGDPRKPFKLFSNVEHVSFHRRASGEAVASVLFQGESERESYAVPASAYVMNADGRTISTYNASDNC